jgi:excisionase family DNA binding protein
MERLINIKAAARKLGGLSVWTLRMWVRDGKLKQTNVGRRTMFRESDLESFVESQNPTHPVESFAKAERKQEPQT